MSTSSHRNEHVRGNGSQGTKHPALKVIIAGGGIGGFTTAIALRRQGHHVEVYEQSRFASEIGAAIHLVPNAVGVLRRLGVGEEKGARLLRQTRFFAHSGKLLGTTDNVKGGERWQNGWFMAHRAYLHSHLKDVATSSEGEGIPVRMHTSSKIVQIDPHSGTAVLQDGTHVQGDLVVGADGVHSAARSAITDEEIRPFKGPNNAIRFLISRESALADPVTHDLVAPEGSMDMWYGSDRKIVVYPCGVNNSLLNFVCIHPAALSVSSDDYNKPVSRETLLEIYQNFEDRVVQLLKKADVDTLKVYPLYDMKPLPSFINDRLALIGDAAHPFTPHMAQGGAMAIEDAASLGVMLPMGTKPEEIPERLKLYNKARYERATTIQNYSRITGEDGARLGKNDMSRFKYQEFSNYAISHDEHHASTQILREHTWKQNPNIYWRQPTVFGPLPGPRQDFEGNPRTKTLTSSSTVTAAIKFKTSATLLRNLFPNTSYSFALPDTVAHASFIVQTMKDMDWLGGGGYDLFALYIHGVQYKTKDGRTLRGSYCPVMFENLPDPILSGREELGYPKLYSDIKIVENESFRHVKIAWRGAEWATLSWHSLHEQEQQSVAAALTNGDSTHVDQEKPAEGIFVHKCFPATDRQQRLKARADVEYGVFMPSTQVPSVEADSKKRVYKADGAEFKINDIGVGKLPTLHHIVSRLAEIPVFEVVDATVTEERGVSDLSNAERIE